MDSFFCSSTSSLLDNLRMLLPPISSIYCLLFGSLATIWDDLYYFSLFCKPLETFTGNGFSSTFFLIVGLYYSSLFTNSCWYIFHMVYYLYMFHHRNIYICAFRKSFVGLYSSRQGMPGNSFPIDQIFFTTTPYCDLVRCSSLKKKKDCIVLL